MKYITNHLRTLPIMLSALLAGTALNAQHWTTGHGDLGVALEDEGSGPELHLHLHLHDGAVVDGTTLSADEEYDAGGLTINVPLLTKLSAGNNSTYNAGTGVVSGGDIWILPISDPAPELIPFVGIGVEELIAADWSTDITFSLGSVTSPSGTGDFALYKGDGSVTAFDFIFSTANGAPSDSLTLSPGDGGHDHGNWSFSEAGAWTVEMTAAGIHNTLGSMSDTQTFQFNVVPEPSAYAALLGMAALGMCVMRRSGRP